MGCLIYGLIDPRDGRLRYVGKTTATLRKRLRAHLNDVKRGRVYIPRHKWMSELITAGLEPDGVEIEQDADDWREAEQFWIALLRAQGCDLLNATAGGDGLVSYRHTEETRRKQSESAKRRYLNPQERERTGEAVRRGFESEEARANLRAARKLVSPETQRANAERLIAYARSAKGRAATSARRTGVEVSEETRQRLSRSLRGKRWTDERRKAASERRLGRRHSEETKAKIGAAHRALALAAKASDCAS